MSLYESSEQMGTAENKGQDFQTPLSAALIDVVQRIVTTLKPEQVILFGSYAYGQPTPDSDVDLLVIMNTSVPDKERYLAVCRLLRPRPFPVDILVRTPQEIAKALAKGDFFIREITSRGKVLYERNH
jgi:predicted nucleotidyltransferase